MVQQKLDFFFQIENVFTFLQSSQWVGLAPSSPNSSPHRIHWVWPLPIAFFFMFSSFSTKRLKNKMFHCNNSDISVSICLITIISLIFLVQENLFILHHRIEFCGNKRYKKSNLADNLPSHH